MASHKSCKFKIYLYRPAKILTRQATKYLLLTHFVAVVAAIVLMVAPPARRYAFPVPAPELRLGALPVAPLAERLRFVRPIPAIVRKVAEPLLRNAPVVRALVVGVLVALRAILRQFIAAIATVVLAVAEEPFGNAAVIGAAWAPLPAGRAVLLPAHVRGLVGVVAAIVVEVAHPELRDAAAVLARELGVRVASAVVAHGGVLVRAVLEAEIIIKRTSTTGQK